MSTLDLRRRIRHDIESLPPSRLRVVAEFVGFLRERGDEAATAELLAIPGFQQSVKQGLAESRHGRVTPVKALRRKA